MLSILANNHRAAHPFRRAIVQTFVLTATSAAWLVWSSFVFTVKTYY